MIKLTSTFTLSLTLCSAIAFAGEAQTYPGPLEAAPMIYKHTLDNASVRVMDVRFEVGAKAPMHTHNYPYVMYIFKGGELTLTRLGGTPEVVTVGNGQALWMPAETIEVANTGTTVIRGSVTEIKRIKTASLSTESPMSAPTISPVEVPVTTAEATPASALAEVALASNPVDVPDAKV